MTQIRYNLIYLTIVNKKEFNSSFISASTCNDTSSQQMQVVKSTLLPSCGKPLEAETVFISFQ